MRGIAVVGLLMAEVFAFDEPGNVLRDFEFDDAARTWGAETARRGQIESFEGLADPLYYLEGEGGAHLHQSFSVATQTWYVLSFRYRLSDGGRGLSSNGMGPDCLASVASGVEKATYPSRSLGGLGLGASDAWATARLFFQTDDAATASLNVAFRAGRWQIGRIFVRKATDQDRRSGVSLCDPRFELSPPGDLPFEWRVTGRHDVRRLTVAEGDVHGGARALRADFAKTLSLVTPMCAFAKSGDELSASVWVKVSRRALVEFKMTNPNGGVRNFNCHEKQWIRPGRWTRLEVTGSPECQPARRGFTGVTFFLNAQAEGDGPVTLLADDFNYGLSDPTQGARSGDPRRPQLPNASFEQGPFGANAYFQIHPTNVNDGVRRTVDVDDATAAVGTCSLRVRGDGFRLETYAFRCNPDEAYTFSFWAKSSRPMRIVAAFPYAGIGEWDVGPDWRRYAGTCAPGRPFHAPGHCTVRVQTRNVAPDNTLWLDGFQLDYGAEAKPFRAEACEIGATFAATYKFFTVGTEPELDIRLSNGGARPLAGEIVLTERDIRGRVTRTKRLPATVRSGEAHALRTGYAVTDPGYHRVETAFVSGGAVLCSNVTTYAGLFAPRAVPFGKSWAGILGGFDNSGRRGSTESMVMFTSGSWNDALDALGRVGFKWLRTMACGNWRNTEYPQGTYNWKWDDYLADAKAHGMGVMVEFLGHDAPPWSRGREIGHPVQGGFTYSMRPADVEKFAEDFARRYAGKFDAVNFINETGDHPPEDYVELMEAAYKGFKRVNPKTVMQGPGFPSSRFPQLVERKGAETWIQRALDCGLNRWNDVHGIHPYDAGHAHRLSSCSRQPTERKVSDAPGANGCSRYAYLAEQARRFKAKYANGTVWDSESGALFNTAAPWQSSPHEQTLDWYTERLAAARMVRCNVLRWSVGVERQFYFMFRHFGLLYSGLDLVNLDMTPRAGVAALSTFYRMLDGGTFERIEELPDGTFTAYFRGWQGENILVYWNPDMDTDGQPDGVFELPKGLVRMRALDMEGRELDALPLSCEPVYVIYGK